MLMVIFGAGASYDSVEAVRPGAEPTRIREAHGREIVALGSLGE